MSWDDVYRGHWAGLVNYIRLRFGPQVDAEDVAQRAIVIVWRKQSLRGADAALVVWHLYSAARYVVRGRPPKGKPGRNGKSPRTDWTRRTAPEEWDDRFRSIPSGSVGEWFPDDLPAESRSVLALVFDGKTSQAEAAAVLGIGHREAVAAYRKGVFRIAQTLGFTGRAGNMIPPAAVPGC